ncbi:TetR/AcrR family transcriptional regulator [Capillimicrobium parvum]|uniref:Fatty acid metabolism regulator protein n=1 Tax=Capillimicrobium parvum TaxID=2884022 RepID=A0A9E6XWA6_9ACTN|nr:TetR/AcrR family transcriptional regulator [Capillimicrobium parvum]UGS35583.1 Fatty acid metabolism regulator protein [Capillimicrobium parvum]
MSVVRGSGELSAARRVAAVERRVAQQWAAIPSVTDNEELLQRRRLQIAGAAYEEFARTGFASTSVSTVARHAGMDKRTLYDYVRDKHDLLYIVFLYFLPRQVQAIGGALADVDDPVDQIRAMARAHLTFLDEHESLGLLYYREMRHLRREQISEVLEMIGAIVELYEEVIRRGADEGRFRTSNARLAARTLAAALDMPSLTAWDVSRYDLSAIEKEILHVVLDGLVA